jgi:hypothetical protein
VHHILVPGFDLVGRHLANGLKPDTPQISLFLVVPATGSCLVKTNHEQIITTFFKNRKK